MKNLFNIIIVSGLLMFSSCDKFLDVEPKDQVELDKLFEEEQGFKDALAGVYIQMIQSDAYGARLTQTTIENLVSSWDVTAGSVEEKIGKFSFEDESVDNAMSTIISKQYAIVASINAILKSIEENKSVFRTPGMYELVKGESLALRAYLHLDIMRLFGPQPANPTDGNELAYVTEFSKSINTKIDFDAYKTLLFKDIQEASGLLKDIDPILEYTLDELRNPSSTSGVFKPVDDFFAFRALRMNYYAVIALSARAHLWYGDKQEAYEAAKLVVDAENKDGSPKFRLGTSADFNAGNYVLREEHIFGLYDRKMYDWYQSRYTSGSVKKGTAVTTIINSLYGNTGSDMRESNLWSLITLSNGSRAHIIRKYEAKEISQVTVATDYKQIPLLRSSEMYLILAETAPFSDGVNYLQQFRDSRGLEMPEPDSPEALQREIIKEYRKEFYAEGQAFYTYKRNNVIGSDFLFLPNNVTVNYYLPLPTVEDMNVF